MDLNEEKKCNHNVNDEDNSLEKVKKKYMIHPSFDFFICKNCHKVIKVFKDK